MTQKSENKMNRLLMGTAALMLVVVLSACSSVNVKKVPTPTQYIMWTDEMQEQADNIEGFRFYLPRPFLNVFESFPVRTDIYLAQGRVSEDGKSVLIEKIIAVDSPNHQNTSGKTLASSFEPHSSLEKPIDIGTRYVLTREPTKKSGTTDSSNNGFNSESGNSSEEKENVAIPSAVEQIGSILSAVAGASKNTSDDKATNNDATDTANTETPSLTENLAVVNTSSDSTGISKANVANDNSAFAYQPLRGNFDIAYLPDFEEQYAISKQEGLGNVEFALNLGQGWSLQSFNSIVDNSAVNERIFKLLDASFDAAKAATGDFTSLFGGIAETVQEAQAGQVAESGGTVKDISKDQKNNGAPITLKMVLVHYAAKGLYPVIKPRELQQRIVITPKGRVSAKDKTGDITWDLFAQFPKSVFASKYDPTQLTTAAQHTDNLTGRFSVPRYPYQYISFNTFRYLAIEKIDGNSKPFEHLYDKTGTKGDPGAAASGDLSALLKMLNSAKKTETETEQTNASSKSCTNKQTDAWNNNYSDIGYLVEGKQTRGIMLQNPVVLGNTISGEFVKVGDFKLEKNINGLANLKKVLLAKLNDDPFLKQFGCSNFKANEALVASTLVESLLNGNAPACEGTDDKSLITCALQTSLPLGDCETDLTLKYVSFDSNILTVSITPETNICKNAKFASVKALRVKVAAYIRDSLKNIDGAQQIRVAQLKFANDAELNERFKVISKE